MTPTILTVRGNYFDFEQPERSDFHVLDIAHALSMICRFTGHCRKFYSVAEHSILVSHLVPEHLALQGLLHDAAEAFVGDVAAPLKRLLPDYKAIERRVEAAVFARFGLPEKLDPEVKHADLVALATEQRQLMNPAGGEWAMLDGIQPIALELPCLRPESACERFMRRFMALSDQAVTP